MTTLVALNTRDALVMGCDSLETMTKRLVDPFDLKDYFDIQNEFKIKVDNEGKPLLDEFSKIFNKSQPVPYNHIPHVDKLFSLSPLPMGVMFAGIVSIGDRTIKNLIGEFKSTDPIFRSTANDYTLSSAGSRLLEFIWRYYSKEYPDAEDRPDLEFMLGGYDKQKRTPAVVRIYCNKNRIENTYYDFGVFLGGQMEEIQRLVFGSDALNIINLTKRTDYLLRRYRELLAQQLKESKIEIRLKNPQDFDNELQLFHGWRLEGLDADWAAFSEQNAIDCVDFLVNIMIRSQRFSTRMPTVGGGVQVAVIKKESGFTFISRREWRHGDHTVPVQE